MAWLGFDPNRYLFWFRFKYLGYPGQFKFRSSKFQLIPNHILLIWFGFPVHGSGADSSATMHNYKFYLDQHFTNFVGKQILRIFGWGGRALEPAQNCWIRQKHFRVNKLGLVRLRKRWMGGYSAVLEPYLYMHPHACIVADNLCMHAYMFICPWPFWFKGWSFKTPPTHIPWFRLDTLFSCRFPRNTSWKWWSCGSNFLKFPPPTF